MDLEQEGTAPELAAVTASLAAKLEKTPGAVKGRLRGDRGPGGRQLPTGTEERYQGWWKR